MVTFYSVYFVVAAVDLRLPPLRRGGFVVVLYRL